MSQQPVDVIARTLSLRDPDAIYTAGVIADELRKAGWHFVATPQVTWEDPQPRARDDHATSRITSQIDDRPIEAIGTVSALTLEHARVDVKQYSQRETGQRFLRLLGHALGVPGCERAADA